MKDIKVIFGALASGKTTLTNSMALMFPTVIKINGSAPHEFKLGLSTLKNFPEVKSIIVSEVKEEDVRDIIEHFFYDRSKLQGGFNMEYPIVMIEMQDEDDAFLNDLPFRLFERCDFIQTTNVNGVFGAEKLQFEVNRIK